MKNEPENIEAISQIEVFYREKLLSKEKAVDQRNSLPALAPDYANTGNDSVPAELFKTSFGCGNPLAFSGIKEGDTVLDLGSGAGLDLILAAERVGTSGKVIGIDASSDMVEKARENVEQSGHRNIEVLNGFIENLPIEAASVDWLISNCVINLSMDKPAVFREMNRVLKPAGKILVSDLVADALPNWVGENDDLYAACISGAVSESKYMELAKEAGLKNGSVVERMDYETSSVKALIKDELPVALEQLSERLGMSVDEALEFAANELSGKITSIKFYAENG